VFAVDSFEPSSIAGLPTGMSLLGELQPMASNTQQCLTLQGTPSAEGVFEVEVTGTLTITVFGAPYVIGDYTFQQTVLIFPNVNGIPGCSYAFASNYNPLSTFDDGSCVLGGCMDAQACNYNVFATFDLGDCQFDCQGCTYMDAENFDPDASVDDGSCVFVLDDDCPFDANGDDYIGSEDLLSFLIAFGLNCN
jgi:hypothetical protein